MRVESVRLLFAALFIILLLSGVATAAGGTFGGGDGSAAAPFIIQDAADLSNISSNLSANYILANNIVITASTWNPIGNGTDPVNGTAFAGTFNGAGYSITLRNASGIQFAAPADGSGIFGVVHQSGNKPAIDNLTIEVDCNVSSAANFSFGILVGTASADSAASSQISVNNTKVIFTNNSAYLNTATDNTGGIVGNLIGGRVSNLTFNGRIISNSNFTGGLVGNGTGGIHNSLFSGSIVSTQNNTGGIIGNFGSGDNILYNNTVSGGTIKGTANVGGVAGYVGLADTLFLTAIMFQEAL